MPLDRSHASFLPTPWTILDGLHAASTKDRQAAEAMLVERYWAPVYAALRKRGVTQMDAQESTQGFFVDVVLGRHLFDAAVREKGRLRHLMLRAVKNYVIDDVRAKRRRGGTHLPLDCIEAIECNDTGHSLDDAFDRAWGAELLDTAIRRVREHFQSSGRSAHWQLFELRVVQPALHATSAPLLGEAIQGTPFESPAAGAAAIQVVKRRLQAVIQDLIAETVHDASDIASEWQHLRAALQAP